MGAQISNIFSYYLKKCHNGTFCFEHILFIPNRRLIVGLKCNILTSRLIWLTVVEIQYKRQLIKVSTIVYI